MQPFTPIEIGRTDSGLVIYQSNDESYSLNRVYLVTETGPFTLKDNRYNLAGMVEVFPGEPVPMVPAAVALDRHSIDRESVGLTRLDIVTREILDEVVSKVHMHERDDVPVLSAGISVQHGATNYHLHVMVGASRNQDGSYRLNGGSATVNIS